MYRLVIVGHPSQRMRERGISERDIYSALGSYVTRIEGSGNSITYIGPGENGKLDQWRPGSYSEIGCLAPDPRRYS